MSDVQEVTDEIQDDTEEAQETGLSWEARAQQQGWKPESEFNGPDGKFVGAEEFVKRGETELPLLRSNIRKMSQKINDLESGAKATAEFITMQNKALKAEAERNMREAADTGDLAAFDQAKQDLDNVPAPQPAEQVVDPTQAFSEDNTWYGVDDEMTRFAQNQSGRLATMEPNLSEADNLKKTAEITEDHFNNRRPAPAKSPSVESRPRAARRNNGKQDFASMPQDQKDMCDQVMKRMGGDVSNADKFKADFALTYYTAKG